MNNVIDTAADNCARTNANGARPIPARCTASDLLRWTGMADTADELTDEVLFSMRRVRAHSVLVREGSSFSTLYFVGSGSFKSSQYDAEGYEQVLGFSLLGDVMGLDGLCEERHGNSVTALEDSMVAMLPYRDLVHTSRAVPALERLLHRAASRELTRKIVTQHVMAAASADVRLVRFLLEITSRQANLGFSSRQIRLRMSRRDIGSYLGVAHETVSRSLSALAAAGYIAVMQRELEILDRAGLNELQRNTRCGSDKSGSARKAPPLPVPMPFAAKPLAVQQPA